MRIALIILFLVLSVTTIAIYRHPAIPELAELGPDELSALFRECAADDRQSDTLVVFKELVRRKVLRLDLPASDVERICGPPSDRDTSDTGELLWYGGDPLTMLIEIRGGSLQSAAYTVNSAPPGTKTGQALRFLIDGPVE